MSAQVLYRKWRPQRLDDVVGQEPVVKTLRQAVAQGRVAHAYLFCGPRGTGKTSTARILAKAINCLEPQDGEPCNACTLCTAISQGEAMDLVEIDAASNRGIDDIRNLRERVYYSPSQARYKVYIIDEVHMLTEAAFNALLKTLEEPPPHTIFVLATTEPHKVPATIISRCQRFDFRRIPLAASVARLRQICESEGIQATDDALWAVARAASGSLRDATNILDQLIVSYGRDLEVHHVQDLLGTGDEERALQLAEHVLAGRTADGLSVIHTVATEGLDLRQFQRQAVEFLRAALLIRSGVGDTLDYPAEVVEHLKSAAQQASVEGLVRAVKLFSQAGIRADNPSPLPLELALVESGLEAPRASPLPASQPARQRRPESTTPPKPRTPEPSAPTERREPAPEVPAAPASLQPIAKEPAAGPPAPADKEITVQAPMEPAPAAAVSGEEMASVLEERWPRLLKVLQRKKGRRFYLGALIRDCRTHRVENGTLVLGFGSRSHMERMESELDTPEGRKALAEGLEQVLGASLEVRLTLANGEAAQGPQGGHLVRLALAKGGRIVEEEEESP